MLYTTYVSRTRFLLIKHNCFSSTLRTKKKRTTKSTTPLWVARSRVYRQNVCNLIAANSAIPCPYVYHTYPRSIPPQTAHNTGCQTLRFSSFFVLLCYESPLMTYCTAALPRSQHHQQPQLCPCVCMNETCCMVCLTAQKSVLNSETFRCRNTGYRSRLSFSFPLHYFLN